MKTRILSAVFSMVFAVSCATTQDAKTEPADPAEAPADASAQVGAAEAEAWRATPPEPGDAPDLVIPEFQKAVLPNGLTVLVSEQHELPLVSVAVAMSVGSAQDPQGQGGLADLTHKLLLEGAGKRDAIELENAFSELGATPFVTTRPDGSMVGTRVLTQNAPQALELLSDIVQRPQLKPAAFELRKKQQLDALAAMSGDPGFLSSWAFSKALYGNHPYGQLGSGTPETVQKLQPKDARAFWAKWSGPKAAALVVTGDVTLEQATAWAQKYFGTWKGKGTRPPVPAELKPSGERQVTLVPKAGLNQTVVGVGRPAIEAGHPDEPALQLATTVFGGFFGSRLNMNLREAKGYSYGAYAYVDTRRGEGPLIASSNVRADVTGPSVEALFSELRDLKQRPITQEELKAAREGLILSLPGSFNTVEDLARSAAGLYWEDKALDHYKKLVDQLNAATPEQVQAAAEKYFDPSKLNVVLVGDPTIVRAQVEPLKLGEINELQPPAAAAPGKKPAVKATPPAAAR